MNAAANNASSANNIISNPNNDPNDNPYTDFQAGLTAALRSWSALRTAVEQSWGGTESPAKAEDLRSIILSYFDGSSPNPKMKLEELEDNLLAYMEEEYGVVLEDGSEREVADLIWNMYDACGRGDVRLARSVVQTAMKAEVALMESNVKSVIQSGEDGDDDMEDDSDVEEGEAAMVNAGGGGESLGQEQQQQQQLLQQTMPMANDATNNLALAYASGTLFGGGPPKPKKELPPPRQLGEPEPEKEQPQVDDDGFAPVATKKKGKKR
ncbi:hypothetical protein ACHAXR_009686 [Thalassiosira sp. AJA248-18]